MGPKSAKNLVRPWKPVVKGLASAVRFEIGMSGGYRPRFGCSPGPYGCLIGLRRGSCRPCHIGPRTAQSMLSFCPSGNQEMIDRLAAHGVL